MEEFIASISGKDGVDGKDGANGKDGVDGKDGLDGKDGKDGVDGKDGKDGVDGVGIDSVAINEKGELVITLSNEKEINLGKVVGESPACVHTFGDWTEDEKATCTSIGVNYRTCEECGYLEYQISPALGHTLGEVVEILTNTHGNLCSTCQKVILSPHAYGEWIAGESVHYKECSCGDTIEEEHNASEWIVETQATCTENGSQYKECIDCKTKLGEEEIPALGHTYVNYVCSNCGDDITPVTPPATGETYTRVDENYILFGSYPQTKVTDSSLTSALTTMAGTLPTASNSYDWTSYGYYVGTGSSGTESNSTNYMWYQDETYGGEKYRGVYFTFYRPYLTYYSSSADYTYQDNNGYTTSTIYWFRYEPIKWRIMTEENGYATLLCEMIIDSQDYNYTENSQTVNGSTVYANNYEYSTIRAWLNENFYETAFSQLQQSIIQTVTVDNSVTSTGYSSNPYACNDTQDKVWLLSAEEAIAMTGSTSNSTVREKQTTDYAQCQGAYTYSSSSYAGNGYWWLRSPDYSSSNSARLVGYDGYVTIHYDVSRTDYGVVPALQIRLSEEEHQHIYGDWISGETVHYKECICGERLEETHTYENYICTECGYDSTPPLEDGETYTRVDENYILFGNYPQTKVTDSSLTSALNTAAGTLPTASNFYDWTSYGYYQGTGSSGTESNSTNYMWYQDETYGGEKYRGVYFTSYRPYITYYSSSTGNSVQDDNGYTTSNIYWFKYEPIKWKVMEEENGYATLLCEMIIDSQDYNYTSNSQTVNGSTVYANNYEYSTIRAWLNATFYETAFSQLQQSIIQTVTVDNGVASTGYSSNPYACNNTQDKVWLLSAEEAIAMTGSTSNSTVREKQTTDYAKCQGAWTSTSSSYLLGYWWLRSPYYYISRYARGVDSDGYVYDDRGVSNTYSGVVPALQIRLS